MVYRFDQFEVNDREFLLSEGGVPVSLEPKVFRLLIYLIENRNRLVRKQELLDKVWPNAVVTENALTRAIRLLRKALHEDSRMPRYVETVPTEGYRFIAKMTVLEEDPTVVPALLAEPTSAAAKFRASTLWFAASGVLLLVAVIAGALLYRHRRMRVLAEKDTIILADFENLTGDPVFDVTLRQGLAVQLEQSPYLSFIPDERIQQVLRQMHQPENAKLTPAVAREVCERTASVVVLDGSITPLGSQYVLGLRARDCQSGKVLAEEQVQAARKEDVLHALDQIAGRFRTRVGESLSTVKKYDTPLAQVTTSSLEALKAYSLAGKTMSEGSQTGSLSFLLHAVELDPNFAVAYLNMSEIYRENQEPGRTEQTIRKAYTLRDKVSERERLWIESNYYLYGTGELEKALSTIELLKHIYPRESGPHESLGMIYRWLGESDKALAEAKESQRLNPKTNNFQNLGADYVDLNRLDEAEAAYEAADERNLPFEGRAKSRYLLAFLQNDTARMAQLATLAKDKPGENAMLGAQADTEAWHGRLRNARELTRRAVDSAMNADAREAAAGHQAWMALIDADLEEPELSRTDAQAAMKLAMTRDVQEMLALQRARTGDTAGALKLASELDKAYPLDTLVQKLWLPVIRAAVAMHRNDPARAVEILQATSTIELANSVGVGSPSLRPVYLRGEAYLMLHDGKRAAAEFQKFIDHRGMVRNSPWGPLARLGLARAYAMQRDVATARATYRDFLAIWKDADPENPVLQQAKKEYAQL
jgi:DNA-binding winged helix-turn-helix (wHTH) protein/tetratricopeptide (TPR) repeat protein